MRRACPALLALLIALQLAACALPAPGGSLDAPPTGGAPAAPTMDVTTGPGSTPTLPPFTPDPPHAPGVADLLAHPPAEGQTVEVDAYFSAAGAPSWPGSGRPPPQDDKVWCPQTWPYTLTDRPYPIALSYLNTTTSNNLPDDAVWLIAVTPEQTQPNARVFPQLPYHARLAGHFGDPAFGGLDCQHGDRIFVVEHVVRVYQQDAPVTPYGLTVPADYETWPRYGDAAQGFSIPHPPDWQAELLDDAALSLAGPLWPGHPVIVRVHEGELNYDQYDPANAPALLADVDGWSQFHQGGWPYDQAAPRPQGLSGFAVQRKPGAAEGVRPIALLFTGHGRTYEISLSYPTGFAASPELMGIYTAIVQGFRLDEAPGPTATPPIRQELGAGPFLTEAEAFAEASARAASIIENLGGELLSEAAARQAVENGPCNTFTGHPEGVWLLRVSGQFEDRPMQLRLLLDAVTGEQLCGEEIAEGQ